MTRTKMSNILYKISILASAALLGGCALVKTPEEGDIKTGGMTSGGWGTSTSDNFAICSVDISQAVASDDRKLSRALIHENGIGAALWYDLLLGDQHQQLDSVRLDQHFHRLASPLMLDGRSIPLTRSVPENPQPVGSLTLTATNDDNFVGTASLKLKGQASPTTAKLSCKRSHRVDPALLRVTTCRVDAKVAAPTNTSLTFQLSGLGSGLRTIKVIRTASSGHDMELGIFKGASISNNAMNETLITYLQAQERVQLDLYPDTTAPGTFRGTAFFASPRLGNGNQQVRCQ